MNAKLESYSFDLATTRAYDFFWNKFCAYYLEIAKPVLFGKAGTPLNRKNKQKLLAIILSASLRLLHPIIPFITEELFQILKEKLEISDQPSAGIDPYTKDAILSLQAKACIVAPYPQVISKSDMNAEIEREFKFVSQMVYLIRNIRGEMKLPPNSASDVYIVGNINDPDFLMIKNNLNIISALVRINILETTTEEPLFKSASTVMLNSLKILIPIPEELLKQELTRLLKEKERITLSYEKIKMQLDNEDFVKRAPAKLIEKQNTLLLQTERELEEITSKLNKMN